MVNDMVIESTEPSPQHESGDASKQFNNLITSISEQKKNNISF